MIFLLWINNVRADGLCEANGCKWLRRVLGAFSAFGFYLHGMVANWIKLNVGNFGVYIYIATMLLGPILPKNLDPVSPKINSKVVVNKFMFLVLFHSLGGKSDS